MRVITKRCALKEVLRVYIRIKKTIPGGKSEIYETIMKSN